MRLVKLYVTTGMADLQEILIEYMDLELLIFVTLPSESVAVFTKVFAKADIYYVQLVLKRSL